MHTMIGKRGIQRFVPPNNVIFVFNSRLLYFLYRVYKALMCANSEGLMLGRLEMYTTEPFPKHHLSS